MPRQKQSHLLTHPKELYPFNRLHQLLTVSHTCRGEEIIRKDPEGSGKGKWNPEEGVGNNLSKNTGNTIRL